MLICMLMCCYCCMMFNIHHWRSGFDRYTSDVAKLRHTGVRALATSLKIIVPLSIANWALKVHKGVEIELRSIAIPVPSK